MLTTKQLEKPPQATKWLDQVQRKENAQILYYKENRIGRKLSNFYYLMQEMYSWFYRA